MKAFLEPLLGLGNFAELKEAMEKKARRLCGHRADRRWEATFYFRAEPGGKWRPADCDVQRAEGQGAFRVLCLFLAGRAVFPGQGYSVLSVGCPGNGADRRADEGLPGADGGGTAAGYYHI